MNKHQTPFGLILASSLGLTISLNSFAVSCGDTITTQETLTEDLLCTDNPALTISGPGGGLDLAGFTVECSDSSNEGIYLTGLAASVTSGEVTNCFNSILLVDDGVHSVTDIEITEPDEVGVVIDSNSNFVTGVQVIAGSGDFATGINIEDPASYNQILGNFVEGAVFAGIYVEGRGNNITSNEIVGSDNFGIRLDPDGFSNLILQNIIDGGAGIGIAVNSDFNLISQNSINNNQTGISIESADNNTVNINTSDNNSVYGIAIQGTDANFNSILSNSADNNGDFDLFASDDPDCTSTNNWIGNSFTTSDPGCLN
ncbi:hypothetical protein BTJ40_14615 [Microbulbifer sp. A4B17]|uniref:right-handed parallel beta-helix repeat-containing protein n=1 Tax=Microbulbifer sp. A4B17 TaxID=359370 RepID=UPI000D52D08F|nr:right-handed parallel beta-helix repeat-containing protein [Microbulbifer sp. A4B17]AWF81958.1 hypothetical protein BTJ40_14615 [Microbulbifer sp. A4B17]